MKILLGDFNAKMDRENIFKTSETYIRIVMIMVLE